MSYQRTTIMDAFNAAGHFTQQALGVADEYKRKEADAFINTVPDWLHTETNNYGRDTPYNPGNLEGDELNKYTLEYAKKQEDFIRKRLSEKFQGRNGGYYERAKEQLGTRAAEAARNIALEKQDEWRFQRENISLQEDNSKYLDAIEKKEMTPQQALTAINNRIELSGTIFEINPQQKDKMRKLYETAAYQKNFVGILGNTHDVHNIDEAVKKAKADFDFMPKSVLNTYDEKGNVTGTEEKPWGFNGKDDWENEEIKKAKERIYGERYGFYQEKQAYRDRLVASGFYEKAIEFDKIWGAEWNKYYDPNNDEHANINKDYMDKGSNFFNSKTLEGYTKLGSGGDKAKSFVNNPGIYIRAALQGGGGFVLTGENGEGVPIENMKDAWENFIFYEEKAFRLGRGENGYGAIADSDWRHERETQFENFNITMKKIIQEGEHKELWNVYEKLLKYDTYRNPKTPYYFRGKIDDDQRNIFIKDCVALGIDLLWSGETDPNKLEKRVKDFIVGDLDKNMIWGQTPENEGDKFKKLMAWDKAVVKEGKGKDMVFSETKMETTQLFSDKPGEDDDNIIWNKGSNNFKDDAHAVRELEHYYSAKMLDLPKEKLKKSWMVSEDKERDPIAKGIFTVEDGDKKGTYRLGFDENGNAFLLKKNEKSGWEKTEYEMERPLTKEEETRQVIQEEKEKREDTNKINIFKQKIRAGKDPRTGENFDYSVPPPNSDITKKQWNNPLYIYENSIKKEDIWANWFLQQEKGKK